MIPLNSEIQAIEQSIRTHEKETNRRSDEPLVDVKEEINQETEDNCSICICPIEKGCKISILPCIHKFHHDCISEWTRYKNNCPVCRLEIK